MKKLFSTLFTCLLFVGMAGTVQAQCTNTNQYPSGAITVNSAGSVTNISSCSFATEFSRITGIQAGKSYTFSSSTSSDWITIHEGSASGPVIGFGQTPLTVTAASSSDLYASWNTNSACGTNTSCRTTTVQCTSCAPSIQNDNCSGAISLVCGQVKSGTTIGSTPDNATAPFCNTSVGTGGGVWYKFVGTGSAVTASTCTGTNYDSKLHVYEGSCGSLVCVTGNDDFCGLQSSVTWCAQAGTTYYILVNGFLSATGNFDLTINCNVSLPVSISSVAAQCENGGPVTLSGSPAGGTFSGPGVSGNTFNPSVAGVGTHTITYSFCNNSASTTVSVSTTPSNSVCSSATDITCGNSYSGNTTCGTSFSGPFCGTSSTSAPGVWYHLVGDGAFYSMSTCNAFTNYDTKLFVYEGSCGSLNCITGNDDYFSTNQSCSFSGLRSLVEFCTTAGADYYVFVTGFGSNRGNYQLDVTCSAPLTVDAGDCQTSFVGYSGPGAPDPTVYICPTISGGDGDYTVSISPAADYQCNNGCYAVTPTANTTYTITVTDGRGCSVSDQVDVQYIDVSCGTNGKVQICHVPPGNPANAQTICVGAAAVPAHLSNHDDYLGPCGNTCLSTNPACEPTTCDGGTFTITISGAGFLDETTWSFAGTTGGPYTFGSTNSATVSVPAGTPSEFCITTVGFFNDNNASYTISCGGGVVASGTIGGGQSACVSDICCNGIAPTAKGPSAAEASIQSSGIVAYPNPFNERTTFRFRSPVNGVASITMFALDGKQVAEVFQGLVNQGEVNEVEFNAQGLSAGTYLYRFINANGKMSMGKVTLAE